MNEQNDLTSGLQDFFADDTPGNKAGNAVGGIGVGVLHLVVFAFAIYSGYHGISATRTYHSGSGLGMAAGIVGILVIEAVLIGLYLAYFHRRITGDKQKIAAAATAGLGFVLSCLGIVGDSQMQAGVPVSPWLSAYLTWGLPIAPALMSLGAAVVMATEPKHLRGMAEAVQRETFEETKHTKRMAAKTAELNAAQQLANMQLNGRMDAGRYLLAAYRTPEVQRHIQASALANLPEMMRSIGVDLPYGTVIEGQTVTEPSPSSEPVPAPQPARRSSWVDDLRDRLSGSIPTSESVGNSTHDAPRQAAPTATPAAPLSAHPTGQGNGPAAKPYGGAPDFTERP